MKSVWPIIASFLVAALAIAAYFMLRPSTPQSEPVQVEQFQPAASDSWSFGLQQPVFAQATEEGPVVTPAVPLHRVQLNEIENLGSFIEDGIQFDDARATALETDGFFLSDSEITGDPYPNDFVYAYNSFVRTNNPYARKPDEAVFITSDLALNLYHVLVDRTFQSVEETKFQPMLRDMTEALFRDSLRRYGETSSPELKASYGRLAAFYLVPLAVLDSAKATDLEMELKPEDFDSWAQYQEALDLKQSEGVQSGLSFGFTAMEHDGVPLPQEVFDNASAELVLIGEAKGIAPSPLFTPLRPDFQNDYSQFVPRSHYTKSNTLKSYFIAMMWYGRMGFPLSSPELTRDALLMTGQIGNVKVGDSSISEAWSSMATVIDFFVGDSDDLTAFQYSDLIAEAYGPTAAPEDFIDAGRLVGFANLAADRLPPPRIISEALSVNDNGGERQELLKSVMQFRFMGQRFTPDAYVLNTLTQGAGAPDPETGQMLPSMPTALMPLRVLVPDNVTVKSLLDAWIADPVRIASQGRESDRIIAKKLGELAAEFGGYDASTWNRNIYWRWLDSFRALLRGYGEGYPSFMQTAAWQSKSVGTALGSYTELKHDTLLYAKQSYAELGAGPPPEGEMPPPVKGYVEPDVVFWDKIISLADVTKRGLESRGVFPEAYAVKYQQFADLTGFFRQLATAELRNEVIGDDDFERLRTSRTVMGQIVGPVDGAELSKRDKRSAIIADIHTDALNERILYEATGRPNVIYVAVSDANGTRLTRGAVYSHYEFSEPIDGRLTDEDWQARVYDGTGELPPLDAWTMALIR